MSETIDVDDDNVDQTDETSTESLPSPREWLIAYGWGRIAWVKQHARGILIFVGLLLLLAVVDSFDVPARLWSLFGRSWARIWPEYWLTLVLTIVGLTLLLLGGNWGYVGRWIRKRPRLMLSIGVFLLSVLCSFFLNVNTWVFSTVEVWSEEKLGRSSDELTIQFQGSLNSIGIAPFDKLEPALPSGSPPIVTQAKSSLDPLSSRACSQIMLGPDGIRSVGPSIILQRSSTVSNSRDTTGGDVFSFDTTIGSLNLPLAGVLRFIARLTPNYFELSAQILPASGAANDDSIRIVVESSGGQRWVAEGQRADLSYLINFLTHRIVLDLNSAIDEEGTPVSDAQLALALGQQALKSQDFAGALAYYRLIEALRATDQTIQETIRDAELHMVLGLIQFQLSDEADLDGDQIRARRLRERANVALSRANNLDASNADIYLYLGCLQALKDEEAVQRTVSRINESLAPDTFEGILNQTATLRGPALEEVINNINAKLAPDTFEEVRQRVDALRQESQALFQRFNRTLDPKSEDAVTERLTKLAEADVLGPGRYTSIFAHPTTAAPTYDFYYIQDQAINFIPNQPYTATLPADAFSSVLLDEAPRQLFAVEGGVYYVTIEGLVKFFRSDDPANHLTIIDTDDLKFSSPRGELVYTGGTRQIFVSGDTLFVLGRFGQILRYRVTDSTDGRDATLQNFVKIGARQIFLDGDNSLFVLKEDGSIWRIADPFNDLGAAKLLVSNIDNREIAVDGNLIYMLRINGNIWRYDLAEARSISIDPGFQTETIRLTTGGLLVLKKDGTVWLIRNLRQAQPFAFDELLPASEGRIATNLIGTSLVSLEPNGTQIIPVQLANLEKMPPTTTPTLSIETAPDEPVPTEPTTSEATEPPTEAIAEETDEMTESEEVLSEDEAADDVTPAEVETPTPGTTATSAAEVVSVTEEAAEEGALTPFPDELSDAIETEPTASAELESGDPVNNADDGGDDDLAETPTLTPTGTLTTTTTTSPTMTVTPTITGTSMATVEPPTPLPSPTLVPTTTPAPPVVSTPDNQRRRAKDGAIEIRIEPEGNAWFWIDRTEITNRQYRQCQAADDCPLVGEKIVYEGEPFSSDDYPVVGVNWGQANAYCQWIEGRLPSALEWRLASSPDSTQTYPWGQEIPACDLAVVRYCGPEGRSQPFAVGSKPAGSSPDGVVDLIGNVWEWTSTPGAGRNNIYVTVGGSWSNPDGSPQGGFDAFNPPNAPAQGETRQTDNLGFRCLRPYEPQTVE